MIRADVLDGAGRHGRIERIARVLNDRNPSLFLDGGKAGRAIVQSAG